VKSGELISRVMSDAEGIRNLVGTGLVQLVGGLLTASIALAVLFYLNWQLTTLTLVVLSLFGGVMAYAFVKLRPLFRERWELNAKTTGRLGEALGGIRIVKAYTAEKREERIFTENVHGLFRNVAKSVTAISGISSFSTLIMGAVGVLMIVVGGQAILAGRMTLGDFVMYIFFTGLVAAPLVQISSIATQLSEAFAGLDRIREIRRLKTEDDQDRAREPLKSLQGEVRFESVGFEYREGIPVLKDVSFVAPAGTSTALVGSSGSGKSTLISLVLTFNRPKAGRILVDGHDLAMVRLRDYRAQVGVVLQDNFLFDGTVRENICYSRPDATLEEIREVSRIAHCDEFVEAFPESYETVVGERGVKLSGGQRQRIAIARAILANPRILVLDEATSSLDSESEAMIQDGLRSLRAGRTTFVIAHRLSTIMSADQILVLEHGEIVERGRHEELLARRGRYRELYDRQYKIEMDRFINPGEDFTPEPEVVSPAKRPTGRERL
ncbi:MAG TPA: ABC transporter ATP-binding protein, partial [Vicinamibacteria bacterium]